MTPKPDAASTQLVTGRLSDLAEMIHEKGDIVIIQHHRDGSDMLNRIYRERWVLQAAHRAGTT
jgi:hypothetical protein